MKRKSSQVQVTLPMMGCPCGDRLIHPESVEKLDTWEVWECH